MEIINIKDTLYLVLGKMKSGNVKDKGTDYWKEKYDADSVLLNNNVYYFCMTIIDAEYEDI